MRKKPSPARPDSLANVHKIEKNIESESSDSTIPPEYKEKAKIFGARVKELRTQKGYTQSEFAKIIGISQSSLSGIERGDKARAHLVVIFKIADLFKISPAILFIGQDDHVFNIQSLKEKYKNEAELPPPLHSAFVRLFIYLRDIGLIEHVVGNKQRKSG